VVKLKYFGMKIELDCPPPQVRENKMRDTISTVQIIWFFALGLKLPD
jgi:hypothetical protein